MIAQTISLDSSESVCNTHPADWIAQMESQGWRVEEIHTSNLMPSRLLQAKDQDGLVHAEAFCPYNDPFGNPGQWSFDPPGFKTKISNWLIRFRRRHF